MSDQRLLLGIDLGTSSVKALLVTLDGGIIGAGAAEYPIDRPRPDRAEQDTEAWWAGLVRATRLALDEAARRPAMTGRPQDRVVAIGLAGQMHGTVLLSAAHEVLAPAVIWPDQRSGEEAAALTADIGPQRLIALAGGPLASGFQAATVRWLRVHEPRLLERTAFIVAPKDAVRLRMTGQVGTEPSDASGTGMFSPTSRTWAPELVAAVGVEPDRLPALTEATSAVGTLRPSAAEELGLPEGIPVVAGGADTPAGVLGAGLVAPGSLLLTISSGGQLAVPALTPDPDVTGRSHTLCSVLAPSPRSAGWYRMAAILSAGLALRWLRDSVFALEGPDAYDRMLDWAADVPPGSRGLVFLPYLAGERNPHLDPDARGVLLGLTAAHGRPELVRSVVEGITLGCFDAARALVEGARPPDSIVLAGGGGRSAVWQHIVADVFGLPVRHLESGEQAALGACLLAGAGAGVLDPVTEAGAWARLGAAVEPDPDRQATYRDVYEVYRSGYPKLSEDFRRLRALPVA